MPDRRSVQTPHIRPSGRERLSKPEHDENGDQIFEDVNEPWRDREPNILRALPAAIPAKTATVPYYLKGMGRMMGIEPTTS